MSDERAFEVGRNLAVTPGSVVFRNELIELIQYAPTTHAVHRRPLVIVPPCINKYYILDLQPENSFVRWAVGAGPHGVHDLVAQHPAGARPPRAGTTTSSDGVLAAIGVAQRDRRQRDRQRARLLRRRHAARVRARRARRARRPQRRERDAAHDMLDFADPGDIGVYISRESLAAREPALLAGQRIHGSELAGAFASLRANDLVWNYVVNNYLKGETPPAFDLLYWNGDSANLPGPMYVYYLRNMYLDNRLREPGALTMAGEPIDLARVNDARLHRRLARRPHRAVALGVPDDARCSAATRRSCWARPATSRASSTRRRRTGATTGRTTAPAGDADEWLAGAQRQPGSWWPHWGAWLAPHGGAMQRRAARRRAAPRYPPLEPAPGRYVREARGLIARARRRADAA